MQIPQKNALGEMRPNEPGWNHRGRGRRSPRITEALMSTACTRMPEARAAAFADKAALKTAGSRPLSSSSRSRRGTSTLVPSIGTFVRATLVAPVVFGSFVMHPVMGVTNYCLPSQEWQYDCRQSDAGSLTCPIDQQSCDGGCDDGTTGSTDDQCNQCLSDGHKGLDRSTTCDGSCTPGDVSDPCFKGFTHSPPSTANTTSPPPPAPPPPKLILDEDDHAAGPTGILDSQHVVNNNVPLS